MISENGFKMYNIVCFDIQIAYISAPIISLLIYMNKMELNTIIIVGVEVDLR